MTKMCQSSDLQQVNNVLSDRQFFQYVHVSSIIPSYSTNLSQYRHFKHEAQIITIIQPLSLYHAATLPLANVHSVWLVHVCGTSCPKITATSNFQSALFGKHLKATVFCFMRLRRICDSFTFMRRI